MPLQSATYPLNLFIPPKFIPFLLLLQTGLWVDRKMASAMYTPTFTTTTIVKTSHQKRAKVNYISGLNSFGGLKANNNNVVSLGLPASTQHSFAKIVSSLRSTGKGRNGGGGALSSTCNAAAEIFRIAAIIPGLVLVGVAVGFVLLRIEATVEEAE